jgi:hypothetical protein
LLNATNDGEEREFPSLDKAVLAKLDKTVKREWEIVADCGVFF